MPQGGPLTPLAALLDTLKRENRPPTQAEKDFISAELAKGVPKPSDMTAPPAGAPVPTQSTVGPWYNNPNAADTPTRSFEQIRAQMMDRNSNPSVTDPYRGDPVTRGMTSAANTLLDFVNVPAGLEKLRTGVTQFNSLLEKDPTKVNLLRPNDEVKQSVNDVIGGGLQAAMPLQMLRSGVALSSVLPMAGFTLAQDKASKELERLGISPVDVEGIMNVVGAGALVPGMGHVAAEAPAYRQWHNIDPAVIAEAQRGNGGSFDPITGKPLEIKTGDAIAALGRNATELVTPEPIRPDDLLNFLDKPSVRNALSQPGRMLGVYPGKAGHYTEVSQLFRGPNAANEAMAFADRVPKQQESIFVQGPNGPEFPEVPVRQRWTSDQGAIDLSSLFGPPQKVEIGRRAAEGRYKGKNPATGRTIDIGQDLVNEASNIADRNNVIVRNVPEEWRPRLEEAGIYEGRPVDGLPFNRVFVPGADGLDVSGESAKRANLLADFGQQVVGAQWHDSPTFFNLMNDIVAPSKDPRVLAARLFGAVSPKVGLGDNLTTMLEIANRAKMLGKNPDNWTKQDFAYVTQSVTSNKGSKLPNVRRAFRDEPLSSYNNDSFSKVGKTEHLAQLMLGNPLGEPFDIHNMRSLGLSTDARMLNAASYDAAAQATARMARAHGMEPAVHMSNRWAGMKRLTNTEGSLSPEQMLNAANIDSVPGTRAFARQLAQGIWGKQGQLVKSLALPVAAAGALSLLPEEDRKKLLGTGGPALGMTFFVKPGVTGEGFREHGTASETGRVPDVSRRKAATAVAMNNLKELLDLHNVAPDVQERIGMIAAQYPRVMAHLLKVIPETESGTHGAFYVYDTTPKRGDLSLNFESNAKNPLSEIFAHELQHAGQNIFTKNFTQEYLKEDFKKGYVKNKYEVAARGGAAKREFEAQIMQLEDSNMAKAASRDPLSSAIKGTAVPSQSVTPPGQKMAALSPKRISEIMGLVKSDTKGLPTQENMQTLESMLKRPEASLFNLDSEYPRLNAKDEPKFILPTGHVIAGPIGMIHTKFAGQTPGSFNHIMELGAHRISYDKAENDIGQGIETWTPFGWRAADSIAQLHETAAFGIRPSKPESIATLVDVHKSGDASKPLAYRYTDYLGGKSIYDLTADKLRAFADSLFAKAKK